MAKQSLTTIKNWFRTRLKPTQAQYWDTWDSFWHKDETIPVEKVENLADLLAGKATNERIDNLEDQLHPPVTINPDCEDLASIDENQILTVYAQDISMKAHVFENGYGGSELQTETFPFILSYDNFSGIIDVTLILSNNIGIEDIAVIRCVCVDNYNYVYKDAKLIFFKEFTSPKISAIALVHEFSSWFLKVSTIGDASQYSLNINAISSSDPFLQYPGSGGLN